MSIKGVEMLLNELKSHLLTFFTLVITCSLLFPSVALAEDKQILRFGVLSIAQPSRIFNKWQPFADYIESKMGGKVEIVVPRGFGKMKKAIADGEVDFFYINSHVFYRLKKEGKAQAIAQMQNIAGNTTSKSEIFVKRNSGINSLNDLKGKNIAFVSPMGAGGYLAPRALLYQNGLKSGVDNQESFTKNLSNSIHGVLLGDYDAATMCGVNYKLMSQKIETGDLVIIANSSDYPENVIGVRVGLSEDVVERLTRIVVNMRDDVEGAALLESMKSMKIQSFLAYDNDIEKITEKLLKESQL